jgi:hypothetical protein
LVLKSLKSRNAFAKSVAGAGLEQVDLAVAFLWYYRQTLQYLERTPSELAQDLHEEGFSHPNVTRLRESLAKSRFATRGKKPGSFQLNLACASELDQKYSALAEFRSIEVAGDVLPAAMVQGTRTYLEKIVHQINACYEVGLYDGAAVLCRRLMESLLIEVYIASARADEIKSNGVFLELSKLIAHIKGDKATHLARESGKTIDKVKGLGDTAAHDRTYITQKQDIDEVKNGYRKLIAELMTLARIS